MSHEMSAPTHLTSRSIGDVMLLVVATCVAACAATQTPPSYPTGSFCSFASKFFQAATWTPINPATQLRAPIAILTCETGHLEVTAASPGGGQLVWTRRGNAFEATIPENHLVTFDSVSSDATTPGAVIDIRARSGDAFVSDDFIGRYGFVSMSNTPVGQQLAPTTASEEMRRDLAAMAWEPVHESRRLGQWDMLWTGHDGRVEIEVFDGRGGATQRRLLDGTAAVIRPDGSITSRRRLIHDHYLILHPAVLNSAEVKRAIGTVLVAKEREQVKAFFGKYTVVIHSLWPLDDQLFREREQMRRKPELD